jgi:hypothetical protein
MQISGTTPQRPTQGPGRDAAEVIELDVEVLEITELSPYDGTFIGKSIGPGGFITEYPKVTWWRQAVTRVPASIVALCGYLGEARGRNACLIRAVPANLSRAKTRRQIAHVRDKHGPRGDHGFVDAKTILFFLDVDGAKIEWRADPQGAVRRIVARLGEPWVSASFCWFFSAMHGLERDDVGVGVGDKKRWTGAISDGDVRVRLAFLTERPLTWTEAAALTRILKATSGLPLDEAICRQVQPNYIRRPNWEQHPGRDPLGDIATLGWVRGKCETVAVPADLERKARWAQAQGIGSGIADHPDALSAVLAIGANGLVREHLKAAVLHLLKTNRAPDHISYLDFGYAIAEKLTAMVERHKDAIVPQLLACGRKWADVGVYLPDNMADWAWWCLEHGRGILNRKTIRLGFFEQRAGGSQATAAEIFERVRRTVAPDAPGVRLLIAPTGSRKSTLMRAAAVQYVKDHPGESVVILVPRHRLVDEQVAAFLAEHPGGGFTAAVWRGRHRNDPEAPDPDKPGKFLPMCRRSDVVKEMEAALVGIDGLCSRGRGKKAVRCSFFDVCGVQRQKRVKANIWLAAHEMMVHEMPPAFGKVGRVFIDESPLDAFMFGVDRSEEYTLAMDALLKPPRWEAAEHIFSHQLTFARKDLHQALCKLVPPDNMHIGAPVTKKALRKFFDYVILAPSDAPIRDGRDKDERLIGIAHNGIIDYARHNPKRMAAFEWYDKQAPAIRPNMTADEVGELLKTAAGNATIKKLVTLWELLGDEGRVQVHRGKEGSGWRAFGGSRPVGMMRRR